MEATASATNPGRAERRRRQQAELRQRKKVARLANRQGASSAAVMPLEEVALGSTTEAAQPSLPAQYQKAEVPRLVPSQGSEPSTAQGMLDTTAASRPAEVPAGPPGAHPLGESLRPPQHGGPPAADAVAALPEEQPGPEVKHLAERLGPSPHLAALQAR